jgi:multidrug efflux pump subunit AcrA (membrane-fusion protein)
LEALERDQHGAAAKLAAARRKRQAAVEALEELGGHRRFTRRSERRQTEQRLQRAQGLEAGAESVLENLAERQEDLNCQVDEWNAWYAEHGREASRLREVDSLIAEYDLQHRPGLSSEPGVTRGMEQDVGIDLGP